MPLVSAPCLATLEDMGRFLPSFASLHSSIRTRAGCRERIRSQSYSRSRFPPVTTRCMHRPSRRCAVLEAMCCTALRLQKLPCTSAPEAATPFRFGYTRQSFSIPHDEFSSRIRRSGKSHSEAHNPAVRSRPTICCSARQTGHIGPHNACQSLLVHRPNRAARRSPDQYQLRMRAPNMTPR